MNKVELENMAGKRYYDFLMLGNSQPVAAEHFSRSQNTISISVRAYCRRAGLTSPDKRKKAI